MGLTLASLCAHPEWAEVEVLAGGDHLGVEVSDVSLLAPGEQRAYAAGTLLVPLGATDVTDWRIDVLLRSASDAGAAGVLLPARTPLLPPSALLADRLRIAVLGSDRPVTELAVGARERIAAPALDRGRFVLAAHSAIARRLAAPDEVAGAISTLLGAEVAVLDRDGSSIAGAALRPDGFEPHTTAAQRFVEDDSVVLAVAVLAPIGSAAEFWIAAALAPPDAEWERTVREVLAVAGTGLQRWQAVRRTELERDARLRASLLAEVLRLEGDPPPGLRRRISEVGWRLDGWHIGIQIGGTDDVDLLMLTDQVRAALRAEGVPAEVVDGADGWSAWVTFDREPEQGQVGELVNATRRAQRRLDHAVTTYVGVGRAHHGPVGIARSLGEAGDSARLARNRHELGRFLHIDRLGLAQLLLAWTRTDTFEPAARDLLAPLHGQPGDLVHTLSAYLDAESRLTETAAVLGVHRNTVATRIAKVEELLGVRLEDVDERLALHLACRAVAG